MGCLKVLSDDVRQYMHSGGDVLCQHFCSSRSSKRGKQLPAYMCTLATATIADKLGLPLIWALCNAHMSTELSHATCTGMGTMRVQEIALLFKFNSSFELLTLTRYPNTNG
jgi:hypothetical protein